MKDNNKKFIILTGLSGAGKSTAIKYLEDAGFFCVDNFLPTLLPNIAHICIKSDIRKVALVIDARGGDFYKQLVRALKKLKLYKIKYRIIFLEAKDDSIIRRFSETRRKHPLSDKGRVSLGIKKERHILEKVRSISDRIIDTTNMLPKQLNYEIYSEISTDKKDAGHFNITVLSFGYKYGIPVDSDLVFDVRFIPNPYYVKKLQNYTGLTDEVRDYVIKWSETKVFIDKLFDMISFLIPFYIREGKSNLTISFGCTGGKHRSVTIARELFKYITNNLKYKAMIEHRDVKK